MSSKRIAEIALIHLQVLSNPITIKKDEIRENFIFFILFTKVRRREKDAEFGNRKKTIGFLFPKLYRVYSEW